MPLYTYVSLKTLTSSTEGEYFNIFGVITRFQAQGVYVRDETLSDSVRLDLSTKCDQVVDLIKTGDIMRVHRLRMTGPNTYVILKASDVVVFPSFEDKDSLDLMYNSVAESPTLERSDFERVSHLESWLSNELLRASLSSIKTPGWINLVFRIADVRPSNARMVLIVYDGTKPDLNFRWMTASDYEHSEEFIFEHLVTISVWDRHAKKSAKFRRGDLAVIFNLDISKGKGTAFELHLRGGTHHGKCIRNIHPNSSLGQLFTQSRAQRSTHQHRPRVRTMSSSLIGSTPTNSKIPATSSPYRESSPVVAKKGIKKQKFDNKVNFPVFIDIPIPKSLLSLSEYVEKNTDEVCCVKAHVANIIPANPRRKDEVKNYIKCLCPSCKYDRVITTEQFNEFVESNSIVCQICYAAGKLQQTMVPYFYATFILSDDTSRIRAVLSGYYFDILLGISIDDVLTSEDDQRKVLEFFRQVFPSISASGKSPEKRHPNLRDYRWIIDRQDSKKSDYRVISILLIP